MHQAPSPTLNKKQKAGLSSLQEIIHGPLVTQRIRSYSMIDHSFRNAADHSVVANRQAALHQQLMTDTADDYDPSRDLADGGQTGPT